MIFSNRIYEGIVSALLWGNDSLIVHKKHMSTMQQTILPVLCNYTATCYETSNLRKKMQSKGREKMRSKTDSTTLLGLNVLW